MRIGIYGYGNLGRGIEIAARRDPDTQITGIFSARIDAPATTAFGTPLLPLSEASRLRERIDVMLIAHGSAQGVPQDTPRIARDFQTVDAFDTHGAMEEHIRRTDAVARACRHTAMIGCGWDPGILSIFRLLSNAVLSDGACHTFWGPGVSEGHSDAIRSIPGVVDAVQFTVPDVEARRLADCGIACSAFDSHVRDCYVACAQEDRERIAERIRTMPFYFEGYRTNVHFESTEQIAKRRAALPHRGETVASCLTGVLQDHRQTMTCTLGLESNPEFTALVMLAYARAAMRFSREQKFGAFTPLQVPPDALCSETGADGASFL